MNRSPNFFETTQYRLCLETILFAIILTIPTYLAAVYGLGLSQRVGWLILGGGVVYIPLLFMLVRGYVNSVAWALIALQWVYITIGVVAMGVWGDMTLLTAAVLHVVAAYLLLGRRRSSVFILGHGTVILITFLNNFLQRPSLPPYTLTMFGPLYHGESLYFGIIFLHLYLIIRGLFLSIRLTQQTISKLELANRKLRIDEQTLRLAIEERTKALSESEEKNRAIVEALPDAMSRVTNEGVYIDFRVPPDFPLRDKIELNRVGKRYSDFVPAKTAAEFLSYVQKAIRIGKRVTYKRALAHLDATIEVRISKLNDSEAISIIRDVTQQTRAEQQLKESEARYRAFVAASPDVLIRLDREGYYLDFWMPEDFPQQEYLPAERSGRHLSEFVSEEIYEQAMVHIKAALTSGQMQIFHYVRPKTNRHFEARIVPDGDSAITAIIREVTQQRQELERLQAVIGATPVAVIVFDKREPGTILWANEVACFYARRSLDEFIGIPIWKLIWFKEKSVLKKIIEQLEANETIRHLEAELRVEKDRSVWFRFSIFEMVYDGRQARMAFIEDIDELRRTTAVFQRVQKLDSLGVLAGGIAHDFNNLLTSIMAQTNIAQRKLALKQDAAPHLEKALFASEKAAELTQQMLAFSGKGQIESRHISVNKLVNDNLALFEAVLPKYHRFSVKEDDGELFISGDSAQIQQVLMNLLLNAAQALEERTAGKIELHLAERWLAEGVRQDGNTAVFLKPGAYASIIVADNGAGMNKETVSRIFEPFFTTKVDGHGLGLAAVVGIVRGHGGEIMVQSERGQGTTIELLLPLVQPAAPPRREPVAPLHPLTSKSVLVIDDEAHVLESLHDMLSLTQKTVLTARGGENGLETFYNYADEIGLVILDLSMPDRHGSDVFIELREHAPALPIILCSGYSEADVAHLFTDEFCTRFVQKPFKATTLLTVVNQLMNSQQPDGGTRSGE